MNAYSYCIVISYIISGYVRHSDNIITQRGTCICTKRWLYERGNCDLNFLGGKGMFMVREGGEEGLKIVVWNVD